MNSHPSDVIFTQLIHSSENLNEYQNLLIHLWRQCFHFAFCGNEVSIKTPSERCKVLKNDTTKTSDSYGAQLNTNSNGSSFMAMLFACLYLFKPWFELLWGFFVNIVIAVYGGFLLQYFTHNNFCIVLYPHFVVVNARTNKILHYNVTIYFTDDKLSGLQSLAWGQGNLF